MDLFTINYIKNNPLVYNFLRENSYWYKALNRDGRNLKYLEEDLKKKYKLTTEDKLANFSRKINMISAFMDVLK